MAELQKHPKGTHPPSLEVREKVAKQYPGLGMEFTLNDRVATYFPPPGAKK